MRNAEQEGIRICKEDNQQFIASKMSRSQYNSFCECYIKKMISLFDEKERNYQKKYKKPSGKFTKESKKVLSACS